MSAPAGGQRPLAGEAGYKRLVRLLARAFYAGECPPKEPEPEDVPAAARGVRKDKVGFQRPPAGLLPLSCAAGNQGKFAQAPTTNLQPHCLPSSWLVELQQQPAAFLLCLPVPCRVPRAACRVPL